MKSKTRVTPKDARGKTRNVKISQPQIDNIIERISDGFVAFDAEMNYTYINEKGGELLGRRPEDLIGKNYWTEYPEAKGTPFANAYIKALKTQTPLVIEDYYEPFDRWFENRIYPSKDGLSIFFTEITERKRAEQLLLAELNIMERLSAGVSLDKVLAVIVERVESLSRDTIGSILLLDPDSVHVHHGAAPHLPDAYNQALEGAPIGPQEGSCGTAMYLRRQVIVTDIETDPLWSRYRELARTHGLRACWSTPVMDAQGKMLASFAMYYREPRSPIEGDFKLIERMTYLAQLAIERKRAEETLRANEEQLSRLVETVPDSIVIVNREGHITFANPAAEKTLGLTRNAITERGYNDPTWKISALDGGPFPTEELPFVRVMRTGEAVYDVEHAIEHSDGTRVFLSITAAPLHDARGELAGMVAALADITERRRAEEALRKSEQTFSVIFNKAPFAAGLASLPDGAYLEVNEEFERIFGFSREEIIGRTSLDLGMYPDPEARARSAELFRKQGFVHNLDMRLQTRTGEVHDVLINSDLVEIGGKKYILTTANDITDRKRAQEMLQRNEQVLRLFVEHSPAAIAMFDRDMKYIVASHRFLLDYDLGNQDVVGHSHYEIFPEIPERWKEIHQRCLAGATEKNEEDPFPRANGWLDWVRWEIRPWYEANGEIGGIILFSEVITERKRAEEELRLSRDRLAELSRRLVETHETEQRAIGRELHDQIGQMLTALKLTLEIAPQLPPETSVKKLAQAQELVDDLMKRVSRLSLELRPPMLDDLGILPALLWHIHRYQEQTEINVEFHHSGIEGNRFGNEIETTVYRLVQESFTNVARHARATRIRLEVQREAGWMKIQIEDNGVGFDPQSALAKNRGLGGMRERVRLLGGSFQIESQPGAGAKKFIQLPLREETT